METKEPKNIYQRINAIMADVDYIQKGEKTVDGQYRYVSHDAVSAVIHKACVAHGVVIMPDVLECETESFQAQVYNKFDKKMIERTTYICRAKVKIKLVNVDNPADFVESGGWPGMGLDTQDKAIGKAISYACKYALLKTFLLETGDNPEEDQNTQYDRAKPKVTKRARNEIYTDLYNSIEAAGDMDELSALWITVNGYLKEWNKDEMMIEHIAKITALKDKKKADIEQSEADRASYGEGFDKAGRITV